MPLTPIAVKTYKALLSQAETNAPITKILQNNTGLGAWLRDSEGVYKAPFVEPIPSKKIFIPQGTAWRGSNTFAIPITNEATISGWAILYGIDSSEQCSFIGLDIMNSSFTLVDLGTLITTDIPIQFEIHQ